MQHSCDKLFLGIMGLCSKKEISKPFTSEGFCIIPVGITGEMRR